MPLQQQTRQHPLGNVWSHILWITWSNQENKGFWRLRSQQSAWKKVFWTKQNNFRRFNVEERVQHPLRRRPRHENSRHYDLLPRVEIHHWVYDCPVRIILCELYAPQPFLLLIRCHFWPKFIWPFLPMLQRHHHRELQGRLIHIAFKILKDIQTKSHGWISKRSDRVDGKWNYLMSLVVQI